MHGVTKKNNYGSVYFNFDIYGQTSGRQNSQDNRERQY